MNRYIVEVTIIASQEKAGFIIYGNSTQEADAAFIKFFPGLNDTNLFSLEIIPF